MAGQLSLVESGKSVNNTDRQKALDAALAQGVQRALARLGHALGADGAVELVFDLQQAGAQLAVAAIGRLDQRRHAGQCLQAQSYAFSL